MAATTLYVAETGDDGNDGSTWPLAKRSIQGAVDAAGDGDVILVSNGTYTAAVDPVVNLVKSVDIRGVNGPGVTMIDGENARRCVYSSPTTDGDPIFMSGFTIRHGSGPGGAGIYKRNFRDFYLSNCVVHSNYSTSGGGGIYKSGSASAMYLDGCIVSNNISDTTGGGIYAYSARLAASNCEVVDNVASNGGGGLYGISAVDEPGMIFEMYGCRIERNIASTDSGGGFYVYARDGSTGMIANCEISYNQAASGGGGILHRYYATAGDLIISNSIIRGNTAAYNSSYAGGGIRINSPGIITGCLIVGNRATAASGGAGGLALEQPVRFRVENTTIASNSAPLNGGGLVVNANVTTNMVVRNTIVYGNSAPVDGRSNMYLVAGTGVILTNCCVAPLQNGTDQPVTPDAGNRTDDPMFAGMEAGNFRLSPNSPYINAGANMPWMDGAVDLDRRRRIDRFSGLVDLGCYEYVGAGTMFSLQ